MTDFTADRRTAFSAIADEYDRGRPGYPDEVFDALGPLAGLRVADIGAGTGIATRALVERSADVVAVDPSEPMLARTVTRAPGLPAVIADGARLPFPDESFDLVTFAQSWHWLAPERRGAEMHRVLRPGGRWAGWWNHARGADWLDTSYWDLVEAACPGVTRGQRDTDWGADVRASGRFIVGERVTVAWTRTMTLDHALTDDASRSYIAALAEPDRVRLLADLRALYVETFPDGTVTVPVETWLWIGTRAER